MSVIAKLYFDGGERTLSSYRFEMKRGGGFGNQVPTFPNEMTFELEFDLEKGDEFFTRWMVEQESQRVEIVLYDIRWKRVVERFELIYCTPLKFETLFDHQIGSKNLLVIDALTMITNEVYYTDMRFGAYLTGEIERPKKVSKEPEIVGYYFKDLEGNRISQDELEPDMEIYLYLETENALDQTLIIALNDPRLDYEYEGEIVKNDVLKDISITGDTTCIKLKTVEPKK